MADYSIEVSIPNVGPTGTVDRVIAANDSSAGLRITQTGSGNALVVEDSANPDATPFIVNNVGQIISGATASFDVSAAVQISSDSSDAPNASLTMRRCSSSLATESVAVRLVRTRGTATSPSIVQNSDQIGRIQFLGYNGSTLETAATIQAFVDGTPGASADMPGRLIFATTADGSGTVTERMRIDSAGNVGIGGTANAAAILDAASTTKGFLPPRMTTTQRNAISTPPAGLMVYNSTTNKLNFYNGTAWEAVTSS